MPHCIIEYSSSMSISASSLIEAVHQGTLEADLFDAAHIKTRALPYTHFQLGDENQDFIHVTIRLHSGRTTQQKQQLTAIVLQQLKKLPLKDITVTVETVDIDTESYAKAVIR